MQHPRQAWRATPQASRPRRATPTAVKPSGGSSTKVVHSPVHPDTPAPVAPTAATPVAPASDLKTRQLRLLPWQTSASVTAPGQGTVGASNDPNNGDGNAAAAEPVSGVPAAGPTSAQSVSGASSRTRLQRRRTAAAAGGASAPSSNAPSSRADGGAGSVQVAPAAAVCEACGGKRFVLSSRGKQPCQACQQWRQRPDYHPGGPLLTLQDVNLAALDSVARSSSSGSEGEGGEGVSSTGSTTRRRRKTGPMSEQRRQAISRALQSKGAKSAEHKRSISRAMREAHARNPQLRRSAVGLKKRCGHCGQEGHNRKTCPQLVDTAAGAGGAANVTRAAAVTPAAAAPASKVIVIEEVDEKPLASEPALSNGISNDTSVKALGGGSSLAAMPDSPADAAAAAPSSSAVSSNERSQASPAAVGAVPPALPHASVAPLLPPVPYNDLLPTRQLAPGMALSPEGGWIFLLPRSKEECVTQAAQAVLRAWDDGMRRHTVELLLPQADPSADGGWPGGIRQQFRVAKPMVESLLLRLKQHEGLGGRITAELLDEGDCVGAWQSERLGAVLFPTADTLPDLRRIDDALSGERLTLVINPQWQIQGQVISDFGIGRTRKVAERFVAAFEEVYYLRRVRVFGDDVRIMRCYPGQWQVHYVPSDPRANTVLLSCEDAKPTFQRLIQLLKAVRGSRASKTWLDRVLTASMGSFNEFAAYSPEAAAAAAAAVAGDDDSVDGRASTGGLASSTEGLQQQPGQEEQIAGTNLQRDIVTGELLPSDDDETPVRDIRLDPLHGVKQITKWLP